MLTQLYFICLFVNCLFLLSWWPKCELSNYHFVDFGFSAAGWPLTKPLQCCSLRIERRGTTLLLIFTYQQEGDKGKSKLFALCSIDLTQEGETVEHFVEAVTDSTRYFVIRVKDEKTEREARIGLGFREREESADFRAALQKYENDLAKERTQRGFEMASSHQK